MPPTTHVLPVTRECSLDGRTLHFTVPAMKKIGRHNLEFLKPHEVPEFEGKVGWFECRREGGRMRLIRQVDPPAHMLKLMRSIGP